MAHLRRTTPYLLIILLALALRLAIYAYGLPFVENIDEPNMYLLANDWRGKLDAAWRSDWLQGYPPGYIWTIGAVMDTMDRAMALNIHTDMAVYIHALRLLSVAADLVTLSAVMALARWLSGDRAALLAGMVWALSAPVTFNATAALPDALAVMFCALSALTALGAIRSDHAVSALLATAAGLLAVVFKYPLFPILMLPALAVLVHLWRHRRFWLAGVSLAMVAATAYGLMVIYGARNLENREAEAVRNDLFKNLLDTHRWGNALSALVETTGPGLVIIGLLALVMLLIQRRRVAHPWLALGLLAAGAALFGIVPAYTRADTIYATRYTWPASLFVITLLAAAIEQASFSARPAQWKWAGWAASGLVLIALLPPAAAQVTDLRRPDTRRAAQAWFETTARDGANVWTDDYRVYRTLSRYEAGYDGFKAFGVVEASDRLDWDGEPAEFDYVFLDADDRQRWPLAAGWPPLDELTLLKHIAPGDALRGPELYIYSTQPPPTEPPVVFSGPQTTLYLRRLALDRHDDRLSVYSLWQPTASPPPVDFSYFLHLSPADEPANLLAQVDQALGGTRPTSSWHDPDESLEVALELLAIPDLPPGEYVVTFGVYYWETGAALALGDGQTALELLRFTVE